MQTVPELRMNKNLRECDFGAPIDRLFASVAAYRAERINAADFLVSRPRLHVRDTTLFVGSQLPLSEPNRLSYGYHWSDEFRKVHGGCIEAEVFCNIIRC